MLFELILWIAVATSADAQPLPFHVIVHRSNPVTSVTRAELSAIYLKRMRSWPGGSEIEPVDNARMREPFSQRIHGKSLAYVTRYWQRLIFAGRAIPPPERGSNESVIAFVSANRGAIGYVARDAQLSGDVKAITVRP